MSNFTLSPLEITQVQKLANDQRHNDKLNGSSVGSKIFNIMQNKEINVLLFSLNDDSKNSILGLYIRKPNSINNKSSHYVAINTSVPYDDMIFNMCHEYYHYLTDETDKVLVTRAKKNDDICELKANRFAAEYLLPKYDLELFIKSENDGSLSLEGNPIHLLYRIIVMCILKYKVSYKSVVKRLFEINAISEKYKLKLLKLDERKKDTVFYSIGINLGGDDFKHLNRVYKDNKKEVVSSKDNTIVSDIFLNYDKGRISLDTLKKDLAIFGMKMGTFGYKEEKLEFDDEMLEILEENEGNNS